MQENCENIDEVDKSTRDLVNKYNDYEKAVKAKEEGTGNKKQVEKVENELKTLVQKAYPLIITNDTKEGENLKNTMNSEIIFPIMAASKRILLLLFVLKKRERLHFGVSLIISGLLILRLPARFWE